MIGQGQGSSLVNRTGGGGKSNGHVTFRKAAMTVNRQKRLPVSMAETERAMRGVSLD